MTRELRIPVLAVSSQNREAGAYGGEKQRGTARLDSLKESGDLEYAADAVLFLTRTEEAERFGSRELLLTVAKHRHGPTGKVHLVFETEDAQIREATDRSGAASVG